MDDLVSSEPRFRPVQGSLIPGMERPVGPIPLSVQTGTNADLMWTIRDLYLAGSVLDVTYGGGKWWERFRPDPFTAHDLELDGVDFRALPETDSSVDTVCFDPPYVLSGAPSSASLGPHFQAAYGIGTANLGNVKRTASLEAMLWDGLTECIRVSRRFVLVKCMEYAQGGGDWSGAFHDIPGLMRDWALAQGCAKHDQIVHHTGTGPGGHNIRRARRARRAHSYLLVFKVRD